MFTYTQYRELLAAFPGIRVIPGSDLWKLQSIQGETVLGWWGNDSINAPQLPGRPGVVNVHTFSITPRIELSFSSLKTLFRNKAIRAITHSPDITPEIPNSYEVFLLEQGGNNACYMAVIEKKYIDIPLAVKQLFSNQNKPGASQYLAKFSMLEIQQCMQANDFFDKFNAFVERCAQGFADSLARKIPGLDERLIFSDILGCLSTKEMLRLREVRPSDADIIENRNMDSAARVRFDRRYGLMKFSHG